jgi:hypothetical protein
MDSGYFTVEDLTEMGEVLGSCGDVPLQGTKRLRAPEVNPTALVV